MRGLPVAMTHGLLGLIVHKSRITEAWKDKLCGVRESVRVIKIIICIFLEYTLVLQFWKEYKFLDADFSRTFSF